MVVALTSRVVKAFGPPQAPKTEGALRFGILGAANVAPMAFINPAKSHPEVIVQAVAARDRKKAEAFAKANSIPEVFDSYQAMLDDPKIDAIFIPLVNSYHFEWAAKSIRAGKHVLLEKPSCANAIEAEMLFNLPELSKPNAPVLLEAFHCRFYPSWQYFQSLINPDEVEHVVSSSAIPWWGTKKEDIHFNYELAGGSIMAMGTYSMAALRMVFGAEPVECLECIVHEFPEEKHKKCDYDFNAKFKFPNGKIGEASTTLKGGTTALFAGDHVTVMNKEVQVPDSKLPPTQKKFLRRELILHGFVHGVFWHRIDIKDSYTIQGADGKVVKKWEEKKSHKAYTFAEAGGEFADLPGEVWWMSFRHQLEQFVNRVKGRPTQHWVDGQDSIAQMKMIDMAYEKSGLGIRPTSTYR